MRAGTRLQAGLVLESGEPREVHHFATLIGYGAAAINPYVMFESLAELHASGRLPDDLTLEQAERNVVKGIGKGLLKTISKMGISTIQSYNGAQIFEAVGLAPELIDRHFTGTASRIGGIGLDVLAREALERHAAATCPRRRALRAPRRTCCPTAALYAWRRDGEHRMWSPDAIAKLQHSVRHGGWKTYEEFSDAMNEESARRASLRGLMKFRWARAAASRSRRSSPRRRSSSASPAARCRSARSRARRTRRWRSP